jgi:integrase/recombinase XerD
MSVFQRGNRWVVDYWPDGRQGKHVRKTLSASVTTREEALQWEEIYRGKGADEDMHPSLTSLKDLYPRYVREWAELQLLPLTAEDIDRAFTNHLGRILGGFPVSNFSKSHINLYKQVRKTEGVKNRTINKELSYLSGFFTWCREQEKIDVPEFRITMLPSKRPKPITLSLEETVRFLAAAEPFYRALFSCLYLLGLRSAEARHLKWESFDFKNQVVLVERTKGGEARILPVPKWVIAFLSAIKRDRATGYIFLNERTGKPVTKLGQAIKRAKERAEISKTITPHLLRHTFATHLLDLNINLRAIQGLLGHARVATTEWYTHLSISSITNAQQQLSHAVDTDLAEALDKAVYTETPASKRSRAQLVYTQRKKRE